MLISPTHKFIFFKPMKCAGSSIEQALLDHCTEDALCTGGVNLEKTDWEYPPQNNSDEEYTKFHGHTWPDLFDSMVKYPGLYDDYRKISAVRNPWEQLVSFYWWNMNSLQTGWPQLAISYRDTIKTTRKKFKAYINRVEKIKGYQHGDEYLLVTPLEFMSSMNERFVVSQITDYIRYEKLDTDFTALCDSFGIPETPLGNLKAQHRQSRKHYSYYYDSESQMQVYDAYQKTISKFKYEFGKVWGE